MPAMSNMPTTASSPAAVVAGMPWSWAAGTKWVRMMPLVDHPRSRRSPTRAQNTQRAAGLAEHTDRDAGRADCARCDSGSTTAWPVRAVREQADVGGPVAQERHDEPRQEQRQPADDQPAAPPARVRGGAGDGRRKTAARSRWRPRTRRRPALAGCGTSGWRRSRRTPAPSPRCRCRCDAPEEPQLPRLGHQRGRGRSPRRRASAVATARRTPKRSISAAANGAVTP